MRNHGSGATVYNSSGSGYKYLIESLDCIECHEALGIVLL